MSQKCLKIEKGGDKLIWNDKTTDFMKNLLI